MYDEPANDAIQAMQRPDWNMRLVVDVALDASTESILEEYNLVHHQLENIKQDPIFQARVIAVRKDLEQNGASFKLKAQLMAEALLPVAYQLVSDPDSGATVRSAVLQNVVRWAGYSNEKAGAAANAGGGFAVNINFGAAPAGPITIEGRSDG